MDRNRTHKVVVIGMDGLMPEMVLRFAAEGIVPHMAGLLERGVFSPMFPTPPVDTPTNWTSLATGAWPGTHGVNSFCIHRRGEPFDMEHYVRFRWNVFPRFPNRPPAYLNRFSRAEYIWQAAERAGKSCILVNYPGGWPPNIERGIVVDGCGPLSSALSRLAHPAMAATAGTGEQGETLPLTVSAATDWLNLPPTARPPLATVLPLVATTESSHPAPALHLLLAASSAAGYDRVTVCRHRDAGQPVATLTPGQWSPWLQETLDSQHGPLSARFRLQVTRLSGDGRQLAVRRSAIWYLDEWAYPRAVAEELVEDAFRREELQGPLCWVGGTRTHMSPLCAVTESTEEQAASIAATCAYLAAHHEWDLFMAQIHSPDGINHDRLNGLCPDWAHYDPAQEEACWDAYRREYRILDDMVGAILTATAHADPLVIALSDHGAIPTARVAWVTKALVAAGLLVLKRDQATGRVTTDPDRSRVILGDFPLGQNIWVNLRGRERGGIVEPGREYEEVREQAIQALYGLRDPETGRSPVALAMRTEDAQFLGPGGPTIGDILYFYAAGYAPKFWLHSCGPFDPELIPSTGFEPVDPEVQGIHHAYLPSQQYAGCSVRATLLMAGPGVKQGCTLPHPPWTVDVAPTIAHVLGIAPPATCEGSTIAAAF